MISRGQSTCYLLGLPNPVHWGPVQHCLLVRLVLQHLLRQVRRDVPVQQMPRSQWPRANSLPCGEEARPKALTLRARQPWWNQLAHQGATAFVLMPSLAHSHAKFRVSWFIAAAGREKQLCISFCCATCAAMPEHLGPLMGMLLTTKI